MTNEINTNLAKDLRALDKEVDTLIANYKARINDLLCVITSQQGEIERLLEDLHLANS